jgi:ATP-dependent RNA helicase RhlE
MSFSALGLSPALCTPLTRMGFTRPTPIQAQAIPLALGGRDLLARAQTGTGKTAAFGLPMIERFLVREPRPRRPRRPRGLVLVPTRELALQVHAAIATHGADVQLRATAVYGGVPMSAQVRALNHGTDIVVATPGRLVDHLDRGAIDLSGVEVLTLDEADRMLDMGFKPALRRILGELPKTRQTLLFSATLSNDVVQLATAFTRNPLRVDVSDGDVVASTVTHHVYHVAHDRKGAVLAQLLKQPPQSRAIVFCRTKRGANRVGEQLTGAGIQAAVIHGNKSQAARTRALSDFKMGRAAALVATDIAARGIDVVELPLVINYDLPLVAAEYVHRVGRTGRAGCTGRAISLVSPGEHGLLQDIQRLLPAPIERVRTEEGERTSAPSNGPRPQSTSRGPRRHANMPPRRHGAMRPSRVGF